eukprot:497193-Amphidinium_carterae.1
MSAEAELRVPHVHPKRPRQPPKERRNAVEIRPVRETKMTVLVLREKGCAWRIVSCLVGMHLVCTSRPRSEMLLKEDRS